MINNLKVNLACVDLVASFEGCRLQAYKCPAGVFTIGYGHTGDVVPRQTVTLDRAKNMLHNDLEHYGDCVNKYVLYKLTQNKFNALVSLCFNIGQGAFSKSGVVHLLNAGDVVGAIKIWKSYNHVGVNVIAGLTARRLSETILFLHEG